MYRLMFWVCIVLLVGMIGFVASSPHFNLVRHPGEAIVRGVSDLHGR